jgi:hypothetical protein
MPGSSLLCPVRIALHRLAPSAQSHPTCAGCHLGPASETLVVLLVQSTANDLPGIAPPTDNNVGTPGGVAGLNLDKEICANVTPNVKGDSRFAQYYLTYGNNFNKASCNLCTSASLLPNC